MLVRTDCLPCNWASIRECKRLREALDEAVFVSDGSALRSCLVLGPSQRVSKYDTRIDMNISEG